MWLKQLSNANKLYLFVFFICILVSIEIISSNNFKAYWFSHVHHNVETINNMKIKVDNKWYPVFNTDKNLLFSLKVFMDPPALKTKTIAFKNLENSHYIEIDILPKDRADEIAKKIEGRLIIDSNIGPLYFISDWFGGDEEKHNMYFSNEYSITITVSNKLDLDQILTIQNN